MQEAQFEGWLRDERKQNPRTIRSRISNCKRVERFEGDLDGHWDADRLGGLAIRLVYSMKDERDGGRPKHRVPIDGNVYKGTATLRNSVGPLPPVSECGPRNDQFARTSQNLERRRGSP